MNLCTCNGGMHEVNKQELRNMLWSGGRPSAATSVRHRQSVRQRPPAGHLSAAAGRPSVDGHWSSVRRWLLASRPLAADVKSSKLPSIERVWCARLVVCLQADMRMRTHVNYILHICNQHTYLLTQLKWQRLPQAQLQSVFDAIFLAHILYASPACRGYLNAANNDSLQQLFVKAQRWKIVSDNYNVPKLFENCDMALFISSLNVNRSLCHLYPNKWRT